MKAKEYGAWPTRNILSGGQHPSYDEYNREYKKVTYTSAEEYASRNVKEYHHYSEYNDITSTDDNKQRGSNNKSSRSRIRVFQQVVCLLAGSTIIVSTYQAMTKQAQAEPVEPTSVVQQVDDNGNEEPIVVPVASVEWIWDDDNKTATARLFDSGGNLIEEVPAEITITTVDPTCNKEGTKTYTASVERDGQSFTDAKTEALEPLGHSFGDGKEIVLDNGQSGMQFECERCHEEFKIATGASENDE
ncbi:MAG: hypothetical protein E7570_00020 [Ruminococcaceae bacterium]|nr:hypothetical protein [Oscillospiraceae bacterium]